MIRPLLLVVAALVSLVPPALGASDDTPDVVAQFEIQSPEPSTSGFIFTRMGVTETLVNADAEGQLVPGLSTDWQVSADGLNWIFTIRPEVSFHDGSALTPETVVNALEIARSAPVLLAGLPISSITAEDGKVVFALSEPLAALPAFLAPFRSQILAPASCGPDGSGMAVIGTGPCRITDLMPPLSLQAQAWPAYWAEPPAIGSVRYTVVSRMATHALMAESGDADFVFGLDPASVSRLSMLDSVDVLSVAIPRTLLVKVRAGRPFLSEPAARRALSFSIDREGIARAVLRYPEGARTPLIQTDLNQVVQGACQVAWRHAGDTHRSFRSNPSCSTRRALGAR